MPIHERTLDAALRICRERGGWTFRPTEIVAALPGLNAASVRTHVMSRCCANAPSNHPHRWPYFRRLRRGVYEIRREWRHGRGGTRYEPALETHAVAATRGVAEASQHAQAPAGIVVEVREAAGEYRAEIPGRPDPIRSASLDDVVMRVRDALREAVSAPPGRAGPIRISVQLEPERIDPVIAEYMKGFDRTLVLQALKMSPEERLRALQDWANAMEEIRGAAWRVPTKGKP